MNFKASLLNCVTFITDNNFSGDCDKPFVFSKNKIHFYTKHTKGEYYLSTPPACNFTDKSNYVLELVYDKNDKKRFLVTLNGDNKCKSFLKVNSYNRVKLNFIHKRYLIQKEPLAFYAIII